ncbi:hypothetical protein ACYOEI_15385 [Singulisphaera rosea]
MLTREQIIASAKDLPREEVAIPELGGSVYVRAMTGTERDAFESRFSKDSTTNIRARLAVATVCDEAGKTLFTEGDIEALGNVSAALLDRIFTVAIRLSKVTKADVDQLRGNSNASPSASSPSGSL